MSTNAIVAAHKVMQLWLLLVTLLWLILLQLLTSTDDSNTWVDPMTADGAPTGCFWCCRLHLVLDACVEDKKRSPVEGCCEKPTFAVSSVVDVIEPVGEVWDEGTEVVPGEMIILTLCTLPYLQEGNCRRICWKKKVKRQTKMRRWKSRQKAT